MRSFRSNSAIRALAAFSLGLLSGLAAVAPPTFAADAASTVDAATCRPSGKTAVIGHGFLFTFAPDAVYELHFVDEKHLDVLVVADPSYPKGTVNHFDIDMVEIRPSVFMITWVEPATGNTVTHVDDFAEAVAHTDITDLASKSFWRLTGRIEPR